MIQLPEFQLGDFIENTESILEFSIKFHLIYHSLVCHTIDDREWVKPHPGTDGKDFEWGDCFLLNYRKKETWDLTVAEIVAWASRGVSGTRMDSAHSWPLILRPNTQELFRGIALIYLPIYVFLEDSDGKRHYSSQEIMDGEIVHPWTDEGTFQILLKDLNLFSNHIRLLRNPKVKNLSKSILHKNYSRNLETFPNLYVLGCKIILLLILINIQEIYWGRELNAIQSGLIPYTSGLPRSLASIFNLGIHKDGSISRLTEKKDVRVFYDWYQAERDKYPQGSFSFFLLVSIIDRIYSYQSLFFSSYSISNFHLWIWCLGCC